MVLIAFLPKNDFKKTRVVALCSVAIQLLISTFLWVDFDNSLAGNYAEGFLFIEKTTWINLEFDDLGGFKVEYFVGLDGIGLSLVMLSCLILVVGVISSWDLQENARGYYALYLLLSISIIGCFVALDFFLFYLFFELMLLPMFFLIGIYGGKRSSYAAIKFFIYTLIGSMFILMAMIILQLATIDPDTGLHSFNLLLMMDASNLEMGSLLTKDSTSLIWGKSLRFWIFWALFIGFAIKLPIVPLHTWLPDAHVEAPTSISVILAGLLLKVGGYGLIRIAYPLFPDIAYEYSYLIAIIGVISILYGGLNALVQSDFKKLIAYSSIGHMGFVVLGLASLTSTGFSGALFQMISHGLISASLFLLVGVVYERTHNRKIENFSGLANKMPIYTIFIVVFFFANLGIPGLSGFIGEVLVLMGSFESRGIVPITVSILAIAGIVVAAIYHLWLLQRMFFGRYWVRNESWEVRIVDLSKREKLMLLPLAVLVTALGIWPRIVLDVMQDSINLLVNHMQGS